MMGVDSIHQGVSVKPSFRQKMDTKLRLIGHQERDQFHLANNPSKDKTAGIITLAAISAMLAILVPLVVSDIVLPSLER